MLEVANVSKEYPAPGGALHVLQDVSLKLDPGDAVAVMGPSGSGKSTLLYVLGALETPTSGSVTLEGQDPFRLGEKEIAEFRNRKIGFLFQDHCLLPQCSVLENVLVPTLVGAVEEGVEQRARWLLEQVGLSSRLDHRPGQLSGGEKQRAALARALIRDPLLLLCDEPTGNLDRQSAEQVTTLLLDIQGHEKKILVVVTHSQELAAHLPRKLHLRDRHLGEDPA